MTDQITNLDITTLMLTLDNAVRASKFPMSTDPEKCLCNVTDTVNKLASNPPGTGHNNFLSGITVQFDLTLSKQAWAEWERYHFQQIISSQSTMHRITRFDIASQCNRWVLPETISIMRGLVAQYNLDPTTDNYLYCIYNIPSGMTLTARVSTNYLQLKTMYAQRRGHRLPEWQELCKWMEALPHSEWITGGENNGDRCVPQTA